MRTITETQGNGLLQDLPATVVIADEIDRSSTGNPFDQVVPEGTGFLNGELNRQPTVTGVPDPYADSSVGKRGEGGIGIVHDANVSSTGSVLLRWRAHRDRGLHSATDYAELHDQALNIPSGQLVSGIHAENFRQI